MINYGYFRKKVLLSFFFTFFTNLEASLKDYLIRYDSPSFSNYGTVGALQNPTSRFHKEGNIIPKLDKNDPYLRGSIVATPFDWMEASFQYTDINNELYSDDFNFSGNQTFKDKSFDAKFENS